MSSREKLMRMVSRALVAAPSNSGRELVYRHAPYYLEMAKTPPELVVKALRTGKTGLSEEEAARRLRLYGPNEIASERVRWQSQLARALVNPFILLLSGLSLVSLLTHDVRGGAVMAVMVLVSVCLTFLQEFRSSGAAERLKAMVSTKVTVTRHGGFLETVGGRVLPLPEKKEIPLSELVPGDLVHLSAGDMIPGDVRLVTSKDLFVSQSALTGESIPVEKSAEPDGDARSGLQDKRALCFLGTSVVSGTASAVVLRTGGETYLGALARVVTQTRVLTSFDRGIHRFTGLMLRCMAAMVPLVFLVNGLTKGDWSEAFLFAVAVAVGLTPEMLPMIVTVNLARGALSMAQKRVVVKRLSSIQNFGAMDTLCTDKTGTLTQDRVLLERYVDVMGGENGRVLRYAYVNSFYQTGLKNLMDVAILRHAEVAGEIRAEHYRKIDEIPFDFSRKRMSVVVAKPSGKHVLICKGALEEMLRVCDFAEWGGRVVPVSEIPADPSRRIAEAMNDEGLRVIAVAYKEVSPERGEYSVTDESGLTLLGYVAFLDPPKENAAEAIAALARAGVKVKVLTGDNDRVTCTIARAVGIPVQKVLLGSDVDALADAELEAAAEQVAVFAKLTPVQKERIVRALHRRGHVVGFLGDGINDAPALKAADVGISVDNAVDVAKESADIILLEKNLLVLEDGVIEGRKVFGNIVKYIKMGASSNFGNVFSVLGSSLFLPFLPMLPVQLLTQNLLYDLSQTAVPFDTVDAEFLERPRRWEIADIGRFMVWMGPVSSLFDCLTFWALWKVFHASSVGSQGLFQAGWFIEGLLSQTLIVHIIRTKKLPFVQSRAAWPLLLASALVAAIGIGIPYSGYGRSIGFLPPPGSYFPWLVAILVGYGLVAETVKRRFVARYDYH